MTGPAKLPLQYAIPATHPARLRARALAHGFGGAAVDAFRFLELRCGSGANLLPIASQFPEASFVGVEPDEQRIAEAREMLAASGLSNVELLDSDDAALAAGERFDYVIAHGIYSWVESDEQRALLASCSKALSSSGVAYVSYNTMPGWSVRGVVRDLMLNASRGRSDEERLLAARSLATKLHRHTEGDHPYLALFRAELMLVHDKSDAELLDDHLADRNEPLYFEQFLRRAAEHGLAYVAEMLPATPDGGADTELVAQLTEQGMSRIDAEQSLDALCYRQLRATLLCREGAVVSVQPDHARLAGSGYFAGRIVPTTEEPLLGAGKVLRFETPAGVIIEVDQPLLKAVLLVLSQLWPRGLNAQGLVTGAQSLLREREVPSDVTQDQVTDCIGDLLQLCARHQLELLPWTPSVRHDLPPKPRLSPLTRLEAKRAAVVTSARHEPVELDAVTCVVAQLLDGSRDQAALTTELGDRIDAGALRLEPELPLAERGEAIAAMVEQSITKLRSLGLLEHDDGG